MVVNTVKKVPRVDHSHPESGDELASFRRALLSASDVEVLLGRVCTQVTSTVTRADMASVTLLDQRTRAPSTAAASDQRVVVLDSYQYGSGEGPCLEAATSGRPVRATAADATLRWPKFSSAIAQQQVRSFLSAPITLETKGIGSLNVYSRTEQGFDVADEVLLRVFVMAVEGTVFNAQRAEQALFELEGLREAMRSRATIEQAKGMVMAIRGINADDAFEVLATQSQNENVKLAVIARRIVESMRIE